MLELSPSKSTGSLSTVNGLSGHERCDNAGDADSDHYRHIDDAGDADFVDSNCDEHPESGKHGCHISAPNDLTRDRRHLDAANKRF